MRRNKYSRGKRKPVTVFLSPLRNHNLSPDWKEHLEFLVLDSFCMSIVLLHDLEAWKTSKPQNRRALFDVELYLTVHKSFVSTSLDIIHRGCTFHLSYPFWTITSLYENTMSSITVTLHKLT
jgi:hypothetical protein